MDKLRADTNIYQKIRRDKLLAMNVEESVFPISSIYAALVYQTTYEGKTYILCDGAWYEINTSFYEAVHTFVQSRVPVSTIVLPTCPANVKEEGYNKLAADSNQNFCLMDQRMVSVEGGPKKIEACDIFTAAKQLIHIKNKGQSSQLSHLFSQGKVSAQCFVDDEEFRRQVLKISKEKFPTDVFNYQTKPVSKEFEVIYGIIDKKLVN